MDQHIQHHSNIFHSSSLRVENLQVDHRFGALWHSKPNFGSLIIQHKHSSLSLLVQQHFQHLRIPRTHDIGIGNSNNPNQYSITCSQHRYPPSSRQSINFSSSPSISCYQKQVRIVFRNLCRYFIKGFSCTSSKLIHHLLRHFRAQQLAFAIIFFNCIMNCSVGTGLFIAMVSQVVLCDDSGSSSSFHN